MTKRQLITSGHGGCQQKRQPGRGDYRSCRGRRQSSNSATPVATETFSDSTPGAIGMRDLEVAGPPDELAAVRPPPRRPPGRSRSGRSSSNRLLGASGTRPTSQNPLLLQASSSPGPGSAPGRSAGRTGPRPTRATTTEVTPTLRSWGSTTPPTPAARAVRRIAPRLRGSWMPSSSRTQRAPGAGRCPRAPA